MGLAGKISNLRARIFVDDPRAVSLPGYANGMILAYQEAERHPQKIDRLIGWAERYYKTVADNPDYTDRDENRILGKLAGYRLAKEAIERERNGRR